MRVGSSVVVDAPIEPVWSIVSDPERVLSFMSGVTRWEPVGPARDGLGARYRMLLRVGAAEVGGLIEVVEWSAPTDFAWTSVTGVDQRGRWRLRGSETAAPGSSCGSPTAWSAPGSADGWPSASLRRPSRATRDARSASSGAWPSTSSCASAPPPAARRSDG